MQCLFLTLALCLAGVMNHLSAAETTDLRVMSFNIRFGSANDGTNAWPNRREFLIETILAFNPDILGTQETLASQRDDLARALPDYNNHAAGRDDGRDKGEMMAIYYRRNRFEKLAEGHFWLSTTPDTAGSKSWDSSLPRMVSWLKLKDKNQPDAPPIAFFNTHFDHRGAKARTESARLIQTRIEEIGKGCRVILTGDFNTPEASEPYKILFESANSSEKPNQQNKLQLIDTFRFIKPVRTPDEGTYSNFKPGPNSGGRIDWIGASRDFKILDAGIDRTSKEGRTPSDHFPVFAVLRPALNSASLKPKQLRVLCYNIYHGEGMDKSFNLQRIAKIIRDANPDFVALQEVDNKTARSHQVDQTAELAQLTGLHGKFGKQIDYQGGEYGQAILSRTPIESSQIHWLPGMPDRERRIAFEIKTKSDGREITFATTHLHHANAMFREMQVEQLNEIYDDKDRTAILAGDMNAMPGSEPINLLKSAWTIANSDTSLLTYPADKPIRQIDYICFRSPAKWRVIEQKVLPEPMASDHRPVLVVLELQPD